MNKLEQKVMCIAASKLFEKGKWDGLKSNDLGYYYKLVTEHSEFRARGELEEDPSYKQIIPQIILRHDNKYFLHRQVKATEERLNALCPLPLGGHVEEFDQEGGDVIRVAALRELEEEVELNSNIVSEKFLGILYLEDENPVNHVHVGLFYLYDLDGEEVSVREDGLENVGFVTLKYLQDNRDSLTFWSRVVLGELETK